MTDSIKVSEFSVRLLISGVSPSHYVIIVLCGLSEVLIRFDESCPIRKNAELIASVSEISTVNKFQVIYQTEVFTTSKLASRYNNLIELVFLSEVCVKRSKDSFKMLDL